MRICGGKNRNMKLLSPKGLTTRPMTARVKEAMFNILAPWVENSQVLDAFSGSGSLGLEALSRGASHCCFVESNRKALDVLQANIEKAGYQEQSQLFKINFFSIAKLLEEQKFDLYFFDPPYKIIDNPTKRKEFLDFVTDLVENYSLADPLIVLHHRKGSMAGYPLSSPLLLKTQRVYGSTELTFIESESVEKPDTSC